MKNTLKAIWFFFMLCNSAVAQKNGILLTSKTDDDTEFFNENKRVKIKTIDGKNHTGRIKIVDENSIRIGNDLIIIDSITKIRSQSLLSVLSAGAYYVLGGSLIASGLSSKEMLAPVTVILGVIAIGAGVGIQAKGNKHKKHKWDYRIVMDYKE